MCARSKPIGNTQSLRTTHLSLLTTLVLIAGGWSRVQGKVDSDWFLLQLPSNSSYTANIVPQGSVITAACQEQWRTEAFPSGNCMMRAVNLWSSSPTSWDSKIPQVGALNLPSRALSATLKQGQ